MNVLLLTSHSIAEHDDLDMLTRMGLPVFSIGAYTDPRHPGDDKRPALPEAVYYPELHAACDEQRARMEREHGAPGDAIDWAKARLAPEVIDWADTIIVHHFPEQWIGGNWDALDGKRIIWRTCGQSDPRLEQSMSRYTADGLQVVRYSPKERQAFTAWGAFAGEDALIRFGKDPDAYGGWTGHVEAVANVTQHMAQRGDACGYSFWEQATFDLATAPAGPGSDAIRGGLGSLDYGAMLDYLRAHRVYLYTGTRPASYTLGLMEAMLVGIPVVAMGPAAFMPAALYEGHEIAGLAYDTPEGAHGALRAILGDPAAAGRVSQAQRARAVELFGLEGVMAAWHAFLGTVPA